MLYITYTLRQLGGILMQKEIRAVFLIEDEENNDHHEFSIVLGKKKTQELRKEIKFEVNKV